MISKQKIHDFEATLSSFPFWYFFSSFFLLVLSWYMVNFWKRLIALKDDLPSSNKLETNSTREVSIVSAALRDVINIPFQFIYPFDLYILIQKWCMVHGLQSKVLQNHWRCCWLLLLCFVMPQRERNNFMFEWLWIQ